MTDQDSADAPPLLVAGDGSGGGGPDESGPDEGGADESRADAGHAALSAARGAIVAEGRGLDVAGARLIDGTASDVVIRTVDGWVVRFPRHDGAGVALEAAVLARLDGHLLVDLPQDVWTGRHTRLIGYREPAGTRFDARAYAMADGRRRNRLAASVARLLVVMHTALGVDEATALGVPTVDPDALAARVVERLDDVPASLRARVDDVVAHFREAWLAEPRPARRVLLHGGLQPGCMALSDPVGEVTGVSDFSQVRLGPPSLDLRYLARAPEDAPPGVCRDLMQRVADQYARTGITLDVDGARAAMAMTDLAAAIESGDFHRFTPDDGVWAWPGADRG